MDQARKQKWNDGLKHMTGPTITLPFDLTLSHDDVDAMRIGWYPHDMDDRWVGVVSQDAIDLYRSWTRHQIYKIPFESGGESVRLGPLIVVDQPDLYNRLSGVDDVAIAGSLLKRYLEHCRNPGDECDAER